MIFEQINMIARRRVSMLNQLLLVIIGTAILLSPALGQEEKTLVFDTFHGQNARRGEIFNSLLLAKLPATIEIDSVKLDDTLLEGKHGLILFGPKELTKSEKQAVVEFIRSGGSLLLIFDAENRTPLYGINDIITPFGLELTGDTPYLHNCGAIAVKSEVCAERRELPYSGGRSINGGNVISRVYMDGDYIHCAYVRTEKRGKIIVMSDAMAAIFMGRPDGIRLTGTKPADTRYWGKDSKIFMEEILSFFVSSE